jgi:hypothetical protein
MSGDKTKNKIINTYRKKIILLLSIPILLVCCFYKPLFLKPYYSYLLITNSRTINGFITNVKQCTEAADNDEGKLNEERNYFTYDYNFTLPSGDEIKSNGVEQGLVLQYIAELKNNSNQIEVQYVLEHPEFSRVKGMKSNETFIEWLCYTLLVNAIIVSVCLYIMYLYFMKITREYKADITKHTYYTKE